MGKISQKDIVLNHLRKYGSISTMECYSKYRITDLQHAIYLLRKENYKIDKWDSYLPQKQIFSQDPTLFDKFVSSPDEFCNLKKLPITYCEIFGERPRSKLFHSHTD